ncbi:nucleotidyltransferase domain-containing protein [Clostridium sp. UBA7503]|uniref:nucleotidyltransferase domain-containing protein n=1 Tax=Clostridium sp. UBA7503 TaxID=1946377 RepID=UPI0032165618
MNFPTKIGTDKDGYIMKFASKDNINSNYMTLIEQLIEILKYNIGNKLHSIYVYGSVGRGEAILSKSDVDLCIIINTPLNAIELDNLRKDKEQFLNKNKSIPKVDFDIGMIDDVLNPENLYYWGFWIKHICDCLYGKDLSVKFPKMKPNKNICKSLNNDIIGTLSEYRELIVKDNFNNLDLKSSLKRIIRGAYCLVSAEDKSWVINTEDILGILNHYFPEESKFKEIELILKDKAENSSTRILEIIEYFILWFKQNKIK